MNVSRHKRLQYKTNETEAKYINILQWAYASSMQFLGLSEPAGTFHSH